MKTWWDNKITEGGYLPFEVTVMLCKYGIKFSQVKTQLVLQIFIFILFKAIRLQHVSASIIGPSSGHNRMKYEQATHCNS